MTVELGTSNTRFSAALNKASKIAVTGTVKSGSPFLTSLGNFDVDLVLEVTSVLPPEQFVHVTESGRTLALRGNPSFKDLPR